MQLPPHIDDSECVVRIIKVPSHWDGKKKRLKTAAFKPRIGKSVISVIRQRMGNDFCKQQAMRVPESEYFGLAVLRAASVRRLECEVYDRPNDYVGHAEIDFGFPNPIRDEPSSAEVTDRLNELCRGLRDITKVFEDPVPRGAGWQGEDLCP